MASSTIHSFPSLENALAIVEFARGIAESPAPLSRPPNIDVAYGFDELLNRMPVRPRVAVDRASHPARNAGHRVQSLEPGCDGGIHQVLEHRAGRNSHHRSIYVDAIRGVAEHHARESKVVARPGCFRRQSACADDHALCPTQRSKRFRGRVRQNPRRTADRESRQLAQRNVFVTL